MQQSRLVLTADLCHLFRILPYILNFLDNLLQRILPRRRIRTPLASILTFVF